MTAAKARRRRSQAARLLADCPPAETRLAARVKLRLPFLPALLLSLALALPAPIHAVPEHWAAEIEALTAGDAAHPPAPGGIVFVGSSSIRLWKTLAADFPGLNPINRGFGGSELADSVHYLDRIVLPYRPRLVVLFAGTNDIWNGKPPAQVAADFRAFRTKLHAALPAAKLVFLSINPAPSRARVHDRMHEANALIEADCATDPRCRFVDVATPMLDASGGTRPELFVDDQLHLNADGYAIWRRVLAPHLQP
jgi:lysophospholipase L1-like esterase